MTMNMDLNMDVFISGCWLEQGPVHTIASYTSHAQQMLNW